MSLGKEEGCKYDKGQREKEIKQYLYKMNVFFIFQFRGGNKKIFLKINILNLGEKTIIIYFFKLPNSMLNYSLASVLRSLLYFVHDGVF